MKKSLLSVAILGAFAGTALAQTNVTLYGIADVGIGMADTDAAGSDSTVNVFSGVQSSSRFGIRGAEDLGGDLKAIFNIEAGVNWDTGAAASSSQFWGRRAVVGLAGGFGEIRLGRDYTPGYSAIGTTDVMGLGLFGNWLDFGGNGGITSRASNGLHYTGKFGGVTLRAMYATGEANGVSAPKGSGDMYGLSGVYAAGPLTLQAYYQSSEFDNGLGGTADAAEYGAGLQYRFSAVRVALNYGMADTDIPGGGSVEHEAFNLGLGVKLGTGELLFNYVQQELDVAGKPEAKSFGIAYVHPLSKRTNLYATYGQMDNKHGGDFALRSAGFGVGGSANADPKAFAVGVRHRF
jgi:predicted porin